MPPPAKLAVDVAFWISTEAEQQGVAPSDMTDEQLQTLAYGLRLASMAVEDFDPPEAKSLIDVANAIDGLTDRSPSDLKFLEDLSVTLR